MRDLRDARCEWPANLGRFRSPLGYLGGDGLYAVIRELGHAVGLDTLNRIIYDKATGCLDSDPDGTGSPLKSRFPFSPIRSVATRPIPL